MSEKYPWLTKHNVKAFLICLAISTGLWMLIKLSEQFTTQATFGVRLVEAPTDQWLTSNEQQSVKFSMQAKGFKTLGFKLIPEWKREVAVSLTEVPFHQENGNTYSLSSQYVAEKIASILGISASDITMNDDKLYFDMETMKSKVVPVALRSDIRTQQRYETYGLPIINPATVTVFGPKKVLDTLASVPTQLLSKSSVNQTIQETVALDLGGVLRCDVKEVEVTIEVLQFTEQELEVPISVPDTLKMRLFPESVKIKYIVAMKDYPSMSAEKFRVEIDPSQIDSEHTLLDVRICRRPDNIELLSFEPQRIEYLILE